MSIFEIAEIEIAHGEWLTDIDVELDIQLGRDEWETTFLQSMIDPEQQRWDTTLNEIEKKAEEDRWDTTIIEIEKHEKDESE